MSLSDEFPWLSGVGLFDPAVTAMTIAASSIPAGIYGAIEAARTGDPNVGAETVRRLQDMYTYRDGTQLGNVLGGAVNAFKSMHPLDQAALAASPVPVAGDVLGLAADARMYAKEPESRNLLNYGLSAAGVLPFVPAASQLRRGKEVAEGALDMAQEARMARAKEIGFDTDTVWYRGTESDEGERVGKFFTTEPGYATEYAYKTSGGIPRPEYMETKSPNIIPAYIKKPISLADDNALQDEFVDWAYRNRPHIYKKLMPDSDTDESLDTLLGLSGEVNFLVRDSLRDFLASKGIENPGAMLLDEMNGHVSAFVPDPSSVRSVNAAFDPAKKDSASLLAGVGGLTVAGRLAMQDDTQPPLRRGVRREYQ